MQRSDRSRSDQGGRARKSSREEGKSFDKPTYSDKRERGSNSEKTKGITKKVVKGRKVEAGHNPDLRASRSDVKAKAPIKANSKLTLKRRISETKEVDSTLGKKIIKRSIDKKAPRGAAKGSVKEPRKASQKIGFKPGELIRINRYLSNAGVCSRREADTFITAGCVTVNGKIVTELGTKVSLSDDVRFNGEQLNPERKVYLLLNKPKGYVTTTDDPQERKTVMDLIVDACPERVYPVGRLDKETTGLLLFTNDGDLAKRLTHPSYEIKKVYQVTLDKPLTKNHLLEIAKGVALEDGFISADAISYVKEEDKTEIGVEIHSGKNRIIRRIFEHFGYNVVKLDRVYFAGLTKKDVPRGKWRMLNPSEVSILKMTKVL